MPRDARLQDLGLPQHVMAQGIERSWIFRDDYDRTGFLLRAARVFGETEVEVLAWALMGNHAHLVLRPTEADLGDVMQRVLGPYAQSFNRRYGRVGPLFRDRFRSLPVDEETGLCGLVGYVILNPLRGGIVGSIGDLDAYPWTSLAELITPPTRRPGLVAREEALSLFGRGGTEALGNLRRMIVQQYREDPEGRRHRHDEPGGMRRLREWERIDLDASHLLAVGARNERIDRELARRRSVTARRIRLEDRGWTMDRVVERAAVLCAAHAGLVRAGSRRRPESRARALAALHGGMYLGISDVAIARATGVSRQAVNPARNRGVAVAAELDIGWEGFFELPEGDAPPAA